MPIVPCVGWDKLAPNRDQSLSFSVASAGPPQQRMVGRRWRRSTWLLESLKRQLVPPYTFSKLHYNDDTSLTAIGPVRPHFGCCTATRTVGSRPGAHPR